MGRKGEPNQEEDIKPQESGVGFEEELSMPNFDEDARQPATAALDGEWDLVVTRVMREITVNHRHVILRLGDEKFEGRRESLRTHLQDQFGVSLLENKGLSAHTFGEMRLEIADSAEQNKPEIDIFYERLNRELNAMSHDLGLENWRDINGPVQLGLRAGDRNKFVSVGGGKIQLRVEDVLSDYLRRVAGDNASLEITGGYAAPGTTAAEFFGGENKNAEEAALEQAFIDLMSRTMGQLNTRLVGIFRKKPEDRRSTFKAGVAGFERKQGGSIARELYSRGDKAKEYLVYVGGGMEIVNSEELKKRFHGEGFGDSSKIESCSKKIHSGLLASGGRIFRIA